MVYSPAGLDSAAIDLAKLARLLPAALLATIDHATDPSVLARQHDLLEVSAREIEDYRYAVARSLKIVSEARVPLEGAENSQVYAFRPSDGGFEHLAVVIGEPAADRPVLTRLHSECFTGDLLGSLRCDCGDQLRGAIRSISEAGSGVLLYLAQEGRGIGLANKLRAYQLQDRGADTIDANQQLGFDADERVYLPAAEMLRQLGFGRVRLLTNNPEKVAALTRCGIVVEERVPHAFPSNTHNDFYLATKASRFGHLF
jgi:GTP cyclohydrolase II